MVGIAQLVSAPDCGSGGQGFESLYPPCLHGETLGYRQAVRHSTLTAAFAGSNPASPVKRKSSYGALAQSVEHLTFNQVVRGSNPRCFTGKFKPFRFGLSFAKGEICGYGGIGRRARFRFWCLRRAGSSPVIRMKERQKTLKRSVSCRYYSPVSRCGAGSKEAVV